MAIALVDFETIVCNGSGDGTFTAFDAVAGNFIAVAFHQQRTSAPIIADTAGNTYGFAGSILVSSNNRIGIAYAYNCLGDASNVVTILGTGGDEGDYNNASVWQFSGIEAGSDPLEDYDSATGSGTAIATPSLTLTADEGVILAQMVASAQHTQVAGLGFTLAIDVNGAFGGGYSAVEHKIVTASQAADATISSGDWLIVGAMFKAAGGGGGGGGDPLSWLSRTPVILSRR